MGESEGLGEFSTLAASFVSNAFRICIGVCEELSLEMEKEWWKVLRDMTHPLVRYSSFITLGGAAIS